MGISAKHLQAAAVHALFSRIERLASGRALVRRPERWALVNHPHSSESRWVQNKYECAQKRLTIVHVYVEVREAGLKDGLSLEATRLTLAKRDP